jgi:hypothetical protein
MNPCPYPVLDERCGPTVIMAPAGSAPRERSHRSEEGVAKWNVSSPQDLESPRASIPSPEVVGNSRLTTSADPAAKKNAGTSS